MIFNILTGANINQTSMIVELWPLDSIVFFSSGIFSRFWIQNIKLLSFEKIGDNLIVRVSKVEKGDIPDGNYFVEKIKERAVQLEEARIYIAVSYKKWLEYFNLLIFFHFFEATW